MTNKKSLETAKEKRGKTFWGCILLLIVISLGVYANSLNAPFVIDDRVRWQDTTWVENRPLSTTLRNLFSPRPGRFYRPIPNALHVIDYHLWGLNPTGFHITNTSLHIIAAILVYLVALKIFKNTYTSCITALLFSTHPLHTETVTYIAGRTDVVMGLFFLLSFLLYIKFREKNPPPQKYLLYTGAILSFIFALMSKESAIALPLILVLYEFYFQPPEKGKRIWRKFVFPLAPPAMLVTLYLLTNLLAGIEKSLTMHKIGMGLQALTASRVVYRYLNLLAFPINLSLVDLPVSPHNFPWSQSFSQPDASLPLTLSFLFIAALFLTYRFSKIVSFGLAWIVLSLLPISNLCAITPAPLMSVRFLYVPSVGFCIVLASVICRICNMPATVDKARVVKKMGLTLLAVFLIIYSFLTVRRNQDWNSLYLLAKKTVQQSPQSLESRILLGEAYVEKHMYDEAISEYKKAFAINPTYLELHYKLGVAYGRKGRLDDAISEFKKILAVHRYDADAQYNLGLTYSKQGRPAKAALHLKKALAITPHDAKIHYSLGLVYAKKGSFNKAISHLQKALAINPDDAEAHYNLGIAYGMQGKSDEAISEFNKAIALIPNYAMAHANLGTVYYYKKEYKLAILHCDRAVELGGSIDPKFLTLLEPYR